MPRSKCCSCQSRCFGQNSLLQIIRLVSFSEKGRFCIRCLLLTSCILFVRLLKVSVNFWYRLVNKINNSIGQDRDSKFLIGVLDIYGFESFTTNRCLSGMLLFSSFMVVYFLQSIAWKPCFLFIREYAIIW